jgi:hypothetical protein
VSNRFNTIWNFENRSIEPKTGLATAILGVYAVYTVRAKTAGFWPPALKERWRCPDPADIRDVTLVTITCDISHRNDRVEYGINTLGFHKKAHSRFRRGDERG